MPNLLELTVCGMPVAALQYCTASKFPRLQEAAISFGNWNGPEHDAIVNNFIQEIAKFQHLRSLRISIRNPTAEPLSLPTATTLDATIASSAAIRGPALRECRLTVLSGTTIDLAQLVSQMPVLTKLVLQTRPLGSLITLVESPLRQQLQEKTILQRLVHLTMLHTVMTSEMFAELRNLPELQTLGVCVLNLRSCHMLRSLHRLSQLRDLHLHLGHSDSATGLDLKENYLPTEVVSLPKLVRLRLDTEPHDDAELAVGFALLRAPAMRTLRCHKFDQFCLNLLLGNPTIRSLRIDFLHTRDCAFSSLPQLHLQALEVTMPEHVHGLSGDGRSALKLLLQSCPELRGLSILNHEIHLPHAGSWLLNMLRTPSVLPKLKILELEHQNRRQVAAKILLLAGVVSCRAMQYLVRRPVRENDEELKLQARYCDKLEAFLGECCAPGATVRLVAPRLHGRLEVRGLRQDISAYMVACCDD